MRLAYMALACLATAVGMAGCGKATQKPKNKVIVVRQQPKLRQQTLTVDSIRFDKKVGKVAVSLCVDYPTPCSDILTNAIAEHINEQLGGTYRKSLNDGDALVRHYGNEIWAALRKDYNDMGADSDASFESETRIKKSFETQTLVTFTTDEYVYLGGAHGSHGISGTTFRKSDGRKFGFDMLTNTHGGRFNALIKKGLKRYFAEQDDTGRASMSDDELAECLMLSDEWSVDNLPLPKTEPYLTEQGVVFLYQQYEIACYAAGMPSFVIPYKDIIPFLNATGKSLFKDVAR